MLGELQSLGKLVADRLLSHLQRADELQKMPSGAAAANLHNATPRSSISDVSGAAPLLDLDIRSSSSDSAFPPSSSSSSSDLAPPTVRRPLLQPAVPPTTSTSTSTFPHHHHHQHQHEHHQHHAPHEAPLLTCEALERLMAHRLAHDPQLRLRWESELQRRLLEHTPSPASSQLSSSPTSPRLDPQHQTRSSRFGSGAGAADHFLVAATSSPPRSRHLHQCTAAVGCGGGAGSDGLVATRLRSASEGGCDEAADRRSNRAMRPPEVVGGPRSTTNAPTALTAAAIAVSTDLTSAGGRLEGELYGSGGRWEEPISADSGGGGSGGGGGSRPMAEPAEEGRRFLLAQTDPGVSPGAAAGGPAASEAGADAAAAAAGSISGSAVAATPASPPATNDSRGLRRELPPPLVQEIVRQLSLAQQAQQAGDVGAARRAPPPPPPLARIAPAAAGASTAAASEAAPAAAVKANAAMAAVAAVVTAAAPHAATSVSYRPSYLPDRQVRQRTPPPPPPPQRQPPQRHPDGSPSGTCGGSIYSIGGSNHVSSGRSGPPPAAATARPAAAGTAMNLYGLSLDLGALRGGGAAAASASSGSSVASPSYSPCAASSASASCRMSPPPYPAAAATTAASPTDGSAGVAAGKFTLGGSPIGPPGRAAA